MEYEYGVMWEWEPTPAWGWINQEHAESAIAYWGERGEYGVLIRRPLGDWEVV